MSGLHDRQTASIDRRGQSQCLVERIEHLTFNFKVIRG
jgi:hypothetical protein